MAELRGSLHEFYKYLPIASVACMESFYRTTIKSLIDKGGIYFDNLETLISKYGQKVDFEILLSLQKKLFTIGEFISHTLPCNALNDLQGKLSILLGKDFLASVRNHRPIVFGEYDDISFQKFKDNYDAIIISIGRTFELRHVFCHESTARVTIDRETIDADFANCELFLNNASNFICSVIYKNWGLTTHDKIDLLSKEIKIKEGELNKKTKKARSLMGRNIKEKIYTPQNKTELRKEFYKNFDGTVSLWKKYIEAKAHLNSSRSISYINSQYIYLKERLSAIEAALNNDDFI